YGGGGGQIQCDVVGETCTHSGRLLASAAGAWFKGAWHADTKCMKVVVEVVYKDFNSLSHLCARFLSIKNLANFVFAGLINN
ncbi:hypothetical protein, partial [Pseudomonas gessardii]|uniref:hypothetical protein n=1 Tax=Pseudomonas gessardii TaxID=78544 RepID=UPI001F1C6662